MLRRRRTGHREPGRARRVGAVAFVVLILSTAVALAWTTSTSNPGNAITAASIGAQATPTLTPTPASGPCTSVLVTWTAATNADRYRVEVNTTGTWSTLAASHTTTSYNDVTAYTNLTVQYRITPLINGTSWEGAPATASVTCGIGSVTDLAATQGCNDVSLAWTAATGANRYDVRVSVNGGAASTIATGETTNSYVDTAVYTPGDSLAYEVLPKFNASGGNWSNTSTITGWDRFRIASVVFTGDSDLNLEPGETVTVTFSKAVEPGTATNANVYTQGGTGTRGIWLGASGGGAGAAEIGGIGSGNNFFNQTQALPGSGSFNGARTVWTWTASGTINAMMDGAMPTTWTQGTAAGRALCDADGTTALAAAAPAVSSTW